MATAAAAAPIWPPLSPPPPVQGLSGKTVVLATNQLQFVSLADLVVVMRGGQAVEVGPYSELLAAGGVLAALMKEAQVSIITNLFMSCQVGKEVT